MIKRYQDFIKESKNLEFSDIATICQKHKIKNWTLNEGLVDVEGDVNLSDGGLTQLPLKFGKVTGGFICSDNQLTTLTGAPTSVGGNFYCYDNQLTSLEGAPTSVGGNFLCSHNQLITLTGAPTSVDGGFDCSDNQLTSLEGAPTRVGSGFYCRDNQLTSLEGAPTRVGSGFYCRDNQLITLTGISDFGDNLNCSGNPVEVIWNFFQPNKKFLDKINHIYTDLWLGDGWTLQGDVLEQIAEELAVDLPPDWVDQIERVGYQVI